MLEAIGVQPLVVPSKFDEGRFDTDGLNPRELAIALARGKTAAVAREYPGDVVLGADTIVVLDGKVIGKPQSPEEASSMLQEPGRTHRYIQALPLPAGLGRNTYRCRLYLVTMRNLTSRDPMV